MRGQRPALGSLLAWVAMLALLLGALPLFSSAVDADVPSALLQMPVEERGGGEVPLHEQAPAKLRRVSLQADDSAATPADSSGQASAMKVVATCWNAVERPLPDSALSACDGRHASAQPPRADAPGLRQQRGQAPPLA